MIALRVKNVKAFMNKLLATDCFDSFLLEEAIISTYNDFTIDGHINREFYREYESNEEDEPEFDFTKWSDIRPVIFQLIKGKRTPLRMKFVLQIKPTAFGPVLAKGETTVTGDDIRSMLLTVRFDQNGLVLITAISMKTFIMDRTPDMLWDQEVKKFLLRKEIDFEDVLE